MTTPEEQAAEVLACDIYDAPDQDCITAGPAVIAAEGLCGPCSTRLFAEERRKGAEAGWNEGYEANDRYRDQRRSVDPSFWNKPLNPYAEGGEQDGDD